MKYLATFSVLLVSVGVYLSQKPEAYRALRTALNDRYHAVVFEKEIRITGLKNLRKDSVTSRLPQDKTTFWWLLNAGAIEAELLNNTFFRSADVAPCSTFLIPNWGCFRISIQEREPHFLVTSGQTILVLGEDGGVITQTPLADLEAQLSLLLEPGAERPKLLHGLMGDEVSQDLFRARFDYARTAIETIEGVTARTVARVDLQPNGELKIKFQGLPFDVIFDSSSKDVAKLEDEAVRLKRLLAELRGRESEIRSIDLAFSKMGVVRFNAPVPSAPGSGAKPGAHLPQR